MRSRILQLLAVVALGVMAMVIDPTPASAGPGCPSGGVLCVNYCPAHPDLLCEAYNCLGPGASCSAIGCGAQPYTVTCQVP